MKTIENWIAAAAIVAAFLGAAAMIDGPSDADVAKATAADLHDARQMARAESDQLARCKALNGPSVEVVQVARTGEYACRIIKRS